MAIPTQSGAGLPIAREQYIDQGEGIDVYQVLTPGGGVKSGQTVSNFFYGSGTTQDNLTGAAAGTQLAGTAITVPIVRFSTVALNASATLLPSVQGIELTIINDGANPLLVFPAVGESINALAANASFSVIAGTPTIFYCVTKGVWHTK